MPAVMRGGSRVSAKPRTKAPASRASRPSDSLTDAYVPGKLAAAQSVGLSPRSAAGVAGLLLALAAAAALVTGDRPSIISHALRSAADSQLAALGFRLKTVRVAGASPLAVRDILKVAQVYDRQPILSLDLARISDRIRAVGWVKEVRIVRLLPDTLVVDVVERRQLAVWQHGGRSQVIDDQGRVIPEADARGFPRLPLVVGPGADAAAAQILAAVALRPRLSERLEAVIRVDDRRWDLRLKDGALIQLPATGEESALIRLDQLDRKTRMLELGFARIDLRDPGAVIVRPRDGVLPGQMVANGA